MENTVKSDRVEGREKEIIKMRAKKLLAVGLSVLCVASLVTGCGSKKGDKAAGGSKPISVVTREDGSGTRGAFIELFGIEQEEGGKKVDKTTASASVSQSTEVMMTTVAGDEYAIGYTSLGALNDKVKALKVDGVEATAENVKSGTYKISRPFNIATQKDVSEAAQDFINYIMSADGQKVVEDRVRIEVEDSGEGIAKEDLPYVWDRYYKVDKTHKPSVMGTGLGLSIVKNILELHDAAYGVWSEEGKGSIFWFELSLATES